MTAITVFLTFLLLFVILAVGAWGGFLVHRRLLFLDGEYRRQRLAAVEDAQHFDKQIGELVTRIESLERGAADAHQYPLQSVNYTQRSQMLRMVRRGDSAEQISSTLGVPSSQVKLLMKLPGVSPLPAKEKGQGAGQSAG